MIYISLFLGFYIDLSLDMPIHCFLVAIVFCEVSLTIGFSVFNQVIFFHVCVFMCGVYACIGCVFMCMCVYMCMRMWYMWCPYIHLFYAWSHVHICVKPKADIKSLSR